MPVTYDIEQDSLYQEGVERGIERKTIQVIQEMLKDPSLTVDKIAQFTGTSVEFVERVKKKSS